MNNQINIGLIGCGRAAELIYLPALKYFPNVAVKVVVDPSKKRRNFISGKMNNCISYDSIDPNLSTICNNIDAAIICSPPDTHASIAKSLLKYDKFVLVEKPLALSSSEIEELSEIEKKSAASLVMAFNHRFWEPAIFLKQTLKKIKPDNFEITFSGNYARWNPVSYVSDALNDLGPHVFDLIRFFYDREILSVKAEEISENNFKIEVKTDNDIVIKCRISHSEKTLKLIMVSSDGKLFLIKIGSNRVQPAGLMRIFLDSHDKIVKKIFGRISPIKKSYIMQLENFFGLVKSKSKVKPGIDDGLKSVHAIEAARKSIKEGKEIFLDEIT